MSKPVIEAEWGDGSDRSGRARSRSGALGVQDPREPRLEARSSIPPATFQALVDSWADLLVADYEALEAASGAYHPEPKEPSR
jgi:hypothetical protein